MSSWIPEEIERELGRLQKTLQEAEAASESLESATEEAMAKNRLVTATVNGRGELIGLKFHTKGYREMAPAELADAILDVVNRARDQMSERIAELYRPLTPEGVDIEAAMNGNIDVRDMLRNLGINLPTT